MPSSSESAPTAAKRLQGERSGAPTSVRAWREGWRRVMRAPALLVGAAIATLLAALPLALVLRGDIERHLGASLMADAAADAVNWDWWQEFSSQATGLGTTLTPSVLGFGAPLDNLSSVLDARAETTALVAAIAAYLGVWLFLSGGIIDRFARQHATGAHGFFAASGVNFWRLLRLAVPAGLAYWFLFAYVHGWLFQDLYTRATRDLDLERAAFTWRMSLYVVFGALLVAVNVVFDYAKVRLVVEDRRSAAGALRSALAFTLRNPGRVIGLYALNSATFATLLLVWALGAPGAGTSGARMWVAALASQLYIVARLAVKLQFLGSATALFQTTLSGSAPPRL